MNVHQILQHSTLSPDDIQARLGKLTASRMNDAMAFKKNGEETEVRRQYKFDLVAERMTDILVPHYVTPAMQHGIDTEPHAKHAYVQLTGNRIRHGVFVDHPMIEFCGATPDAYVNEDGLLEIKCPTTQTYLRWLVSGQIPSEHKAQMTMQILCTGKDWCDFMAYDPRMPLDKRAFIRRFSPTEEERDQIMAAAAQFLREVEELFTQVTEAQ